MRIPLIAAIALFFTACSSDSSSVNYGTLPAYSGTGNVQVVVEIPAGTNKKFEYDYSTNTFPADIKDGKERVVQFIGYPGNYGFIPSTMMDEARGGDGDALDVLVLAEHQPTGTVMEVIPIAVLELEDGGEIDSKIIAVPADESQRVVNVTTYKQLSADYASVKRLVRIWFLGYKGRNVMKFKGWSDEKAAEAEVKKWLVN